jgi:GNAT superfamily N-acetyltransferase
VKKRNYSKNADFYRVLLSKIILDPKIGIILIAKDDDKILGMVNLLFTESTALGSKVALLEDMVILSSSRGRGIGSQLIDYAISEAKKVGCKRITLLTDIENTKAQSFYQKKGFVKSKMTPYRLLLD